MASLTLNKQVIMTSDMLVGQPYDGIQYAVNSLEGLSERRQYR